MKSEEIKKNNHYVWAHYLRGWAENGKDVYRRTKKGVEPYSVRGVACEPHFYRINPLDDLDVAFIQRWLDKADAHLRDFHYKLLEKMIYCSCAIEVMDREDQAHKRELLLANTLENIHTQVHPAFRMAVQDGLILCNPASDVMREIKRSNLWVKPKRHALTIPQQKAFLNFLENNRDYEGWIPIITVLLGTGMRIGECLGLRWKDLDFKEETISVNHNLSYGPDENGECKKHIQTTKTKAGNRVIPMSKDVYEAFLTEYEIQKCLGFCEEEIDGYSGFVFSTATHTVYGASAVNNAIHRATAEYNKQEEIFAREENREPLRLPDFSAHNLRHTYCTRLCENEKNIKVIEYLMGHSDISTTMDIYAEVNQEKLKDVMTNLEGCIIIK